MTAGSFFLGGGDFSTLLSGFHNKTHTPKFFIRPTKKFRRERREETPAEKRKVGAFLGRRGKPLKDARRSKKEKRKKKRGNEKKNACLFAKSRKRRNERLTNTLKKNRVKVARAPSSSSIRTTRGNRRGFVLNEEEGERDGRESFWWRRGRSRANRK